MAAGVDGVIDHRAAARRGVVTDPGHLFDVGQILRLHLLGEGLLVHPLLEGRRHALVGLLSRGRRRVGDRGDGGIGTVAVGGRREAGGEGRRDRPRPGQGHIAAEGDGNHGGKQHATAMPPHAQARPGRDAAEQILRACLSTHGLSFSEEH